MRVHDREIEQRSSPQGDADHGRCDRHDPLGGGLPSAVLLRRVRLRPVHRVGCDRFSFRACSRSGRFSFLSLFCHRTLPFPSRAAFTVSTAIMRARYPRGTAAGRSTGGTSPVSVPACAASLHPRYSPVWAYSGGSPPSVRDRSDGMYLFFCP